MPLRARNLVLQALFDITPVKKTRERIEERHLVHLLRQLLHLVHGEHLVCELPAYSGNLQLLIDHIDVEDQHHAHQPAHGLIEKEGVVGVRACA